uniref:Uncharacterized protein n=1 Tax=Mus spicilegus TaxID=10103 RepID=A0A8C6N180_MUSSI
FWYLTPHRGWQVGQTIILVDYHMVVIHFKHDWDPTSMKMNEKVKNCAIIYLVAFTEVPDFNKMYDLYDLCTAMFFFRNKPIMIDLVSYHSNRTVTR